MMEEKGLAPESSDLQLVEQKRPLVSSQYTDLSSNKVVDEVTVDINKIIQDGKVAPPLSAYCIYRVPITIRDLKKDVYTPRVVSIGPFHHGNKKLQDMEMCKQILLTKFTKRLFQYSILGDLIRLASHLEPKVRASYSETISLNEQQLVKLILMDTVFIIELFFMYHEHEIFKDPILARPWLLKAIGEDLILLENQLPFFIIEELFNIAFPEQHNERGPSFLHLTYKYFEHYNKQGLELINDVKIEHFTDLLRLFYLYEQGPSEHFAPSPSRIENPLSYNVSALQEVGIKLKASTSKCLLELNLSGHFLEIPQIWVEDGTEILFLNMIALEQCHYPMDGYISCYVIMMDWLIDTSKDVELLVRKKILTHHLGDADNVAVLFNGLAKNVCQMNFNSEYDKICKKLNGYCEGRWNQRKANLRRDYCRTPWQTVASIAAIVLLCLTVVQTVFSILQVV